MKNNPIVLLGLFDTAIMTARCIKKKGVTLYGMDYDHLNSGVYSNMIRFIKIPNPLVNEDRCVESIIGHARHLDRKPVLIPTSDFFVFLVAKHDKIFRNHFLYLLPDFKQVLQILDRDKQFSSVSSAGIYVPNYIKGPIEIDSLAHFQLRFPVAIKPMNVNDWKLHFNNKGFIVDNAIHLETTLNEINNKNIAYLIQEIIPGNNTQNYEVNSLFLTDGSLFQHTIRKIRQYPDGFGTATCIENYTSPQLEGQAERIIRNMGLYGFSNIEFKYDIRDNKFYYIESNPRVWLQVNFSTKVGLNFPGLYYNYLTGTSLPAGGKTIGRGKWVDILPDLLFWYKYRKKYRYSLFTFMRSWFPLVAGGLLSLRDPRPFIKSLKKQS